MALTIRPAETRDLTELQALAALTFPDAAPDYIPASAIEEFIAENLSLEAFENYLASADYLVNVAEKDGELIGYTLIDVSKEHNPEGAEDAAYLSKFYLSPAARGTGASRTMMDAVFTQVRELGFDSVWLGTAKENHRSNAFYDKVGFEIVGERRFPVGTDVFGEDWIRAVQL